MTKTLSILTILFFSLTVKSQDIEQQYANLTDQWLELSEILQSYEGLSAFCKTPELRDYSLDILSQLHHYDSVVLEFLHEPDTETVIGSKEYRRSLKDIEKFENDYDNRSFMAFLRNSCIARNELEKDKEELVNGYGSDSYDGQVLVLENELGKFMRHLDRRIVHIEKHLHLIHPDRFQYLVDAR